MAAETQTGRFRAPSSQVFHDRAGSVSDAAAPKSGREAVSHEAGRRIDPPHHGGQPRPSGEHLAAPAKAAVDTAHMLNRRDEHERRDQASPSLLDAHADDLVHHLQAWAEILDRRESELHAAMALQENRERSFRLWAQSQQQQLQQLEREAIRLREELKQQARRLALAAEPDALNGRQ